MMDFYGPGCGVAEDRALLPALAEIHSEIPYLRFRTGFLKLGCATRHSLWSAQ